MAPALFLIMAVLPVASRASLLEAAANQIRAAVTFHGKARELGRILINTAELCSDVGPPFSDIAAPCLSLVGSFLGGETREERIEDGVNHLRADVHRLAADIDANFRRLGLELDKIQQSVAAIRDDVEVLYEDLHLHLADLVDLNAAYLEYMVRIESARTDAADLKDAFRFALGANDKFSLSAYTLFNPDNVNQVLSWTIKRATRGACPQGHLLDGAILFHRILTARFQLFTLQSGAMMLEHGRTDANTIQYAERLHYHVSAYANITGAARLPVNVGFQELQKHRAQCCTAHMADDQEPVFAGYMEFLIDCCCHLDCSSSPAGMEARCPCSPGGAHSRREALRSCLPDSAPPFGVPLVLVNSLASEVFSPLDGFLGEDVSFWDATYFLPDDAVWMLRSNGALYHLASHLCLKGTEVKLVLWWCAGLESAVHFVLKGHPLYLENAVHGKIENLAWLPIMEPGPFCNVDTGGTCSVLGCYEMRGRATCIDGQCLCADQTCAVAAGYDSGTCWNTSRANTTTPYCMKDTGGTCNFFWCSSMRGHAECVDGACLCSSGYCATANNHETGTCVKALTWNNESTALGEEIHVRVRPSTFKVQAGFLMAILLSTCLVFAFKARRSQQKPPLPELAQALRE